MTVSNKHPLYSEYFPDWDKMRDCSKGERVIKQAGTKYLPATSGMIADGMHTTTQPGYQAYAAYRTRAHFAEIVADAVRVMLGAMHHKEPDIELPAVMEPLRNGATLDNESLSMLLQRINKEQLITGRCGLFADLPPAANINELPYISIYEAEKIINWDDGPNDGSMIRNLNFVVLDESGFVRKDLTNWSKEDKYRLLVLGDPLLNETVGNGTYSVGLYDGEQANFDRSAHIIPTHRGTTLDFIPFTFVNSTDIVVDPIEPPMNGLGDLNLAIYRADADYRQNLFMQGQDTLVVVGGNPEMSYRIGAQGGIVLPEGASAQYIGVSGTGLPEMRLALENDKSNAAQKGGQLMDSVSRERESGQALRVRVSARTASLNQIAIAGAYGLENSLRQIAKWIGADPAQVIVSPNLDFIDDTMDGRTAVEVMTAKNMGLPISNESIHQMMVEHGWTQKTFEEEKAIIDDEEPLVMPTTLGAPVADDPKPDDDDKKDDE